MSRESTRATSQEVPRPRHGPQQALGDVESQGESDLSRTIREISRCCDGLTSVDPQRIVSLLLEADWQAFSQHGSADRAIHAATLLIAEEPEYSRVAARLLAASIDNQVLGFRILSFSDAIQFGFDAGLVNDRVHEFVATHDEALNEAIETARTEALEYRGLQMLHHLYLLKHPDSHQAIETPQYFWMRMAVSLSVTVQDAIGLYRLLSTLDYIPSAPILSSAGTPNEQLCSCFLLDTSQCAATPSAPVSNDVAEVATFSGDLGLTTSAAGAQPNGQRSVACVYLEPWHADIERFLDTQHDSDHPSQLNLANWIPDLFMRRVEEDESWSLFDPAVVPELPDLFGDEFDDAYLSAESRGLASRVIGARELYSRMMRTIANTGNGWMTFKDKANLACNQTGTSGNTVHLSSLCTEILEVTKPGDTAVCNLGSINLARHVTRSGFDFQKLANTVRAAVRQLDRAIDLNTYPISAARDANRRWRPVGLGVMGLQDVFFSLQMPFDGYDARQLSTQISEAIYFHALQTSMEIARESSPHDGFADTRAARGELQFDAWGVTPSSAFRWQDLRDDIKLHGLRNSLLIAIAPTSTIAAIAGCHECIEPQMSNFLVRTVPNGSYAEFGSHLVAQLKELGLWNQHIRDSIVLADGSVQGVFEIPEQLRTVFRTAWELSTLALIDLAADRGAFVDQSQSLNLFVLDPNVAQLSNMYMYAWKCGLKTTYSLRARWPRAMFEEDLPALSVTVLQKAVPQVTAS